MGKPLYIKIASPCHQNWSEMTPTQQGAFCKSCNKYVTDFTRKTENEIYELMSRPGVEQCGRFTTFQLSQPVRRSEVSNGFLNWRAIAATLAAFLSMGKTAEAKENKSVTTVQQPGAVSPKCEVNNVDTLKSEPKPTIKGQAIDAETKEPLIAVNVILKNARLGAITDFDGMFDLAVDPAMYANDTLVVKYIGYEDKEIPVAQLKTGEPVVLHLLARELMLMGAFTIIERNPLEEEMGGYLDLTPLLYGGTVKAFRNKGQE